MPVIKINAITVPADSGDELAHRFAARASSVDDFDGFEGFELLKPTDDRNIWLVLTRWRDEESFQAWRESKSFGQAHGDGPGNGEHAGDTNRPEPERKRPVGVSAELWSYEVAITNGASSS